MSGSKEIRSQIKSIKNTQKITKAMEMVAASKMRKAQNQMNKARPYAEKIMNVIEHLSYAHPEYSSLFLKRERLERGPILLFLLTGDYVEASTITSSKKSLN